MSLEDKGDPGERTRTAVLLGGAATLALIAFAATVMGATAAVEGRSIVGAFSPIFNFILEVARAIGGIVLFAMLVAWMLSRTEKKVPLLEKHIESLNLQLANAQQTIGMVQVAHATTLRERHQVEVDIAAERRVLEVERKELKAMREALKARKQQLDKRDAVAAKPGGKSYAWGDLPKAVDAVVAAIKAHPGPRPYPVREAKVVWLSNGGNIPRDDYKLWSAMFTTIRSLSPTPKDAPARIVLQRGKGSGNGERTGERAGERAEAEA